MKVFISHKQEDEVVALDVLKALKTLKVDAYLDLIDDEIAFEGKKLTAHIKRRLNECTDLLVVISQRTKQSWWVPFEIGMATQKNFPIVNYLSQGIELPDYLTYWPRLKNTMDLEKYVKIKKDMEFSVVLKKSINDSKKFVNKVDNIDEFYNKLKSIL